MDRGEISMRIHHLGLETQRGLECQPGALVVTRTGERHSQIKMRDRQPMKQTYGVERAIDRLLIVAEPTVGRGKSKKSAGVVSVEGEGLVESADRVLQLRKAEISVSQWQVDAGILRRGFFGFEQRAQRATEIATREFYPRPEQFAAGRVRFMPIRD